MEYAKSLIKGRDHKTNDDSLEDSEESWTFIGDDNDPELVKKIHDWEAMAQSNSQKRGISPGDAMAMSMTDAGRAKGKALGTMTLASP